MTGKYSNFGSTVRAWAGTVFFVSMAAMAATGTAAFFWAIWPNGWKGEGPAAWVQAVGSIGAILGGFVGVRQQLRTQEVAAARAEARQTTGRFNQIMLLAHEAADVVEKLAVLLSPASFESWFDAPPRDKARYEGQVKHWLARIDGIAASVSDLIRSVDSNLDHINLLLKVQRSLQSAVASLAGVANPFEDLYPGDVDFDEVILDLKILRHTAAWMSIRSQSVQ